MKASHCANLYILLVTIFFGLTFPLIKEAIAYVDPSSFVFVRFLLSALVLLPFILRSFSPWSHTVLAAGLALGLLNCGTYIFQTIGLQTIDASRSAFITSTCVVMVPLFLPLFGLGFPKKIDCIGALLSLLGVYIITGAHFSGLKSGDFWTLACAATYALSVVCIQWVTPKIKHYSLLTFYQIVFTVPVAFIASSDNHFTGLLHPQVMIALLFCGVFATSLALYLVMKYQQHTTATQAALIYALEPVFASFFAYFINKEMIGLGTIMGGGLILISVILPILRDRQYRQA